MVLTVGVHHASVLGAVYRSERVQSTSGPQHVTSEATTLPSPPGCDVDDLHGLVDLFDATNHELEKIKERITR